MSVDPAASASPAASTPRDERPMPSGAEIAVGLVLTVGLGAAAVVEGFLAIFLALAGDTCVGAPDEPLLCDDTGQLGFFLGLVALWLVLALAVLGALVMILLGRRRRRHVWFWPFVGLGVCVLAGAAFFGLVYWLAST